ncbi:Glycine betaine/L-proline transport system permease protein ProW [Roseovarius sp. THAF27]|uniref:ABC transporter permease subunit n=1 Tax=unclassified Roseovarius TaxID=2614913 RepID=UPI001268282F|nr:MULTISPECIES: ABC transporter permease subunit [unclassified Roseovarius]QFT81794.1 Glycine betaine/L-proline transport system permease protein ProW [Roseovarius sp. THAF27]QFT99065.1 Glycine betaine/L-proline transport system permease protein ProW [Roseovarius sp. THAF8]
MSGDRTHWAWFALIGLTLVALGFRDRLGWLMEFPEAWEWPMTDWLNTGMDWVVDTAGPAFRAFSDLMDYPMSWVREFLHWMPWALTVGLLVIASFAVSGCKLAVFTFLAMFYMVVIGYWTESMNSLALVMVSVPLAVAIGFCVGTWAFYSDQAERVITPTMDTLQTIPVFAYLLPILLLFGFGPVVGLIASVLYAVPPMVRNTTLGLARVDEEVIEAGMMAGATAGQMFWRVRVPSALRQILLGVNQTMLAAFSMIIIASIIGGTSDIGWEVLTHIRKANVAEAILAGVVIALMAMVMDRITARAAMGRSPDAGEDESFVARYRYWIVAAVFTGVMLVLARVFPFLQEYPRAWEFYPADAMNDAFNWLLVEYAGAIKAIKTTALFYLMLPVKMGLEQTISPFSWGFEFTMPMKIGYAVAMAALAGWLLLRRRVRAAIGVALLAILLYFGITGLPWLSIAGVMVLLAWQAGGRRLAIGTGVGLAFLMVAGVWPEATISFYLCGLAVALSFLIGTTLGVIASENDAVSAFLRPISDTLQTMPLFVILIPFVMFFKLGDFTALLAIMAYAIVPAIRYAEHGLRGVSPEVIEAAKACGSSRWQMLWRVRLPLALPQLLLGLNQTIMFGVAMLVITALVGTSDLGQEIYIGLNNGDFGVGMIAGIGMATLAMIADRMTRGYSRKGRAALGQG